MSQGFTTRTTVNAVGKSSHSCVADVAILGNSLQAYAAAYLLAKRGKRAVLIEHSSPSLIPVRSLPRRDVVLHTPAATPHLVNEAVEAFALWRGIQAVTGHRNLLHICGSIDLAPTGGSTAAGAALETMFEASKAAGLPCGMLASEQVSSIFPMLRPGAPSCAAALYTEVGAVLHAATAEAVLRAMAQRAGADVAAPGGRCLLGWRDAGSHFALRTTTAAAAAAAGEARTGAVDRVAALEELVCEVEQLLLLPEASVQRQSHQLFGLTAARAQLWRVPGTRCSAQQEQCQALPVWQVLGGTPASRQHRDDPDAVDSCWGLPALPWPGARQGSAVVWQSLADGGNAESGMGSLAEGTTADAGAGSADVGSSSMSGAAAAAAGPWQAPAAAVSAPDGRPGSEEALEAAMRQAVEQQRCLQQAEERLGAAVALARDVCRGLGPRLGGPGSETLHCIVTADGESAVGSHPAHEPARVVVAFPAAGASLGDLPGDQLALLTARLAVDCLLGRPFEAVSAAAVALGRDALQCKAVPLQYDSWEGLLAVDATRTSS